MHKRNLILTIIDGYDFPFVEPFIKSFQRIKFNEELVIFVSDRVSKTTKRKLKAEGAVLINFTSKFPFLRNHGEIFKEFNSSITINNYRFILYFNFLLNKNTIYNKILITDIRDVIFQSNIFERTDNNYLHVFLEDKNQTFKSSQLNAGWYKQAIGKEDLKNIENQVVSCAGVVIGTYQVIFAYLDYINKCLKNHDELNWGLDQGIHNVYIHEEKAKRLRVVKNSESLVLTLGACDSYRVNKEHLLVNDNGEIYSMIHQYDRFEKLFLYFKKKYIGNRTIQILKRIQYYILP